MENHSCPLSSIQRWQIDLGAEITIAAEKEKEKEKIAVEVKTFLRPSFSHEFHSVVGQYMNYLIGLEAVEKDRILFLAVPSFIFKKQFQLESIQRSIKGLKINIIVYNIKNKNIETWIKQS